MNPLVFFRKSAFVITVIFTFAAISCRKDAEIITDQGSEIRIGMQYRVSQSPMLFDTMIYVNASGNPYSVSHLEYFVSELVLHSSQGDVKLNASHYLNARNSASNSFSTSKVPMRAYNGISFSLGVDSLHNTPNGLPSTLENNNMFWPVPMGGGYHFMKLEGHYLDTSGKTGFAIHLGKNENLVRIYIPFEFKTSSSSHQMVWEMDVNEWFEHPNNYNFISDGNYTMSSSVLMKKIAQNGSDVIQIISMQ